MFTLGSHSIRTGVHREEGGWRSRILGYCMSGTLFNCSVVVSVANNYKNKNGKKKSRKGGKVNEKEYKSPLDGIYSAAVMMIRSVHLGSQCGQP